MNTLKRPMSPAMLKLVEEARARLAQRQAAEAAKTQTPEHTAPIVPATLPAAVNINTLPTSTPFMDAKEEAKTTEEKAYDRLRVALGTSLTLNEDQGAAMEAALQGKSFNLIGAAGTGKTTVTQLIISKLERASHVMPIKDSTKYLNAGAPSIVVVGYTNKAVNNLRKRLPPHLSKHCITIHKLLEFAPVFYDIPDPENPGSTKTTMQFMPTYGHTRKLPHISVLISEESSMTGTDLWGNLIAALPNPQATQMIFLGDLNQLPPVFGPSILGFKLAELPIIELRTVYRQALESPIITLATQIRTNELTKTLPIESSPHIDDRGEHGKVTVHCWKKRVEWFHAINMMKVFLPNMIAKGAYNPDQDMILIPFNKSFGTIEINKIIADHLAKTANRPVFEVIARYIKSYWAVGDRVMVDRHEAIISAIEPNPAYAGKMPRPKSVTLDRWGKDSMHDEPEVSADAILAALDALAEADEEAKLLASHRIKVYIPDLEEERTLTSAGDINTMIFGYALTVHKSQGSEWDRVFCLFHNSHATMLSRELVYTAVTRAKKELYIICEGDMISPKGIITKASSLQAAAQRAIVPGTTLAEKVEFFRTKANTMIERD